MIGTGAVMENAVIASVGTAGSTRSTAATEAGGTVLPVATRAGFVAGQSITVGSGTNQEPASIAAIRGGRGEARITVAAPLTMSHLLGAPVSGSGITLGAPLTKAHAAGTVLTTELPTPGASNRYSTPRR
jgi:hypothetical protein